MSDATAISAADVKALRERTGAGVMDCKAALAEAGGDVERAIEVLRVKGQASAAKRSGRATGEGLVAAYIHSTGRVGVLVEVRCETDFVARSEEFGDFAREVALHIAGSPTPPQYVSPDDVPESAREAERAIYEAKAREEGKPEDVIDRIVAGGRPALPGAHPRRPLRGEDGRGASIRAGREDRGEHPDPAVRAVRGGRGLRVGSKPPRARRGSETTV